MKTWEDCIAALRAGAAPESVIPSVHALFSQIKPAEDTEEVTDVEPGARRYQTVPGAGGHVFELAYLRPPFGIWDLLEAEGAVEVSVPRSFVFDRELHVDVMALFQPRFVAPPPPCVRAYLETCDGGEKDEKPWGAAISLSPPSPVVEDTCEPKREKKDLTELESIAAQLVPMCLCVERDAAPPREVPDVPELSVAEWEGVHVALTKLIDLRAPVAVTELLLAVNQRSLAEFVLQKLLPELIRAADECTLADALRELIAVAARISNLRDFSASRIHAAVSGLSSADLGTLGVLAKLEVFACAEIGSGA